jgi:hypothetical protein
MQTNNGLIVSLNAVIIVSYNSRLKNIAFYRPGLQIIGSIKECLQRRFCFKYYIICYLKIFKNDLSIDISINIVFDY